ncbi:hypothetical protein AKG95_07095 [Janthinobacterium lividum]|uniref:Uncharacterized protein n=1 Tax=Janthinobacterium lividum TaxID=29581 RepID=A0A1S1UBH3_9BURK|nr:hypothetical protein AKG95_07095 [Janthinobacterium lividum]
MDTPDICQTAGFMKWSENVSWFWTAGSFDTRTRIVAVGDRLQNGRNTPPMLSGAAQVAPRRAVVPVARQGRPLRLFCRLVTPSVPAVVLAVSVARSAALP